MLGIILGSILGLLLIFFKATPLIAEAAKGSGNYCVGLFWFSIGVNIILIGSFIDNYFDEEDRRIQEPKKLKNDIEKNNKNRK
ncbi:MAG: hypothetical protein ACTSQG_10950 [Promethearchaeota archaeon]